MLNSRTETRWFFAMMAFLIFYCGFLFAFRGLLLNVEEDKQVSIFKPETVQIFIMGVLIILYHFCFLGLYVFSKGSQWQRIAAVAISLLVTGSLLYGFNEWYGVTSEPFFQFSNTGKLPWYAKEKTKFLISNSPLILFLLIVFILRILMIYRGESTSEY